MTVNAKEFTSTKISRPANSAQYRSYGFDWHYKPGDTKEFITTKTWEFVNHTVKSMCRKYDKGPPIGSFCSKHGYVISS